MSNPTTRILVGDARERLAELPDGSVHCCVTSPPYWGLRAYGGDPGMIGLEDTLEGHFENLLVAFREVRRILRPDGTLWLNYGDAYAGSWGAQSRGAEDYGTSTLSNSGQIHAAPKGTHKGSMKRTPGMKPKDLMLLPARVAMMLQDDGWWVRSEIIWHKPNPMPESVQDRPTNAHEKLWLLSPAARYFYDPHAVRLPPSPNTHARRSDGQRLPAKGADEHDRRAGTWVDTRTIEEQAEMGGNLRNVWQIATQPFPEAHFATFPSALVEPCVKLGTSEHGVCATCGTPWRRIIERKPVDNDQPHDTMAARKMRANPEAKHVPTALVRGIRGVEPGMGTEPVACGWEAACGCGAERAPAVVLDPFGGAGTVGLVANRLGRSAVLIEINAEYAAMSEKRIYEDAPLFADVQVLP